VDLSADLPPPRRQVFFPVVIATVLLSIIGMSAGLVLGDRHKHAQNTAAPSDQAQYTAPATSPSPLDPRCPAETQKMGASQGAVGVLRIALEIKTKSTTVWICRDEAGSLFYHANNGGANAPWVEGKTALFMSGVQRDGDGYAVTANDGNTFSITAERLRIVHKQDNNRVETQPAVD
jgi:hypothetical protein